MVRKSELRIKHGTEVAHIGREGYVREERGEPLTVDLRELPVTTEPDGLSLRGIEKKAVSSHPGSKYVNRTLGQFPQPTDQYEHRPGHHQQISDATTPPVKAKDQCLQYIADRVAALGQNPEGHHRRMYGGL